MYGQVLAGLRAHAAAKAVVQGISWASTIVALRLLDSEALGVFAVASAVLNYGALFYEGSLLEALVQRAPADLRERRAVYTLLVGSALLLASVIVALATPVSVWVGSPTAAPVIATVASSLLITALGILPQAELMRAMRFDRLAMIASVQALASAATTVSLAYAGAGAWSLALGLVVGLAVRTVLLNVLSPHLMWPGGSLRGAFQYVRFGSVLIADGILWRWYTSIDTFLLGRWSGAATLGFYSFGQQIANMPLEKISTIVNDVSLPAYAELERNRTGGARLLLETIRTHAAVGLPMFWGLACVAHIAVPFLFGDKWSAAVLPLAAFALIAPIRLMGSVETPAMTGIGRPDVLLRTKAIIVPVMTVALVAGCWWGGVNGAALAWVLVFPVCYGFAFRYVLQAIGVSYRDLFRVVRGPLIAAGLMAVAVHLAYLLLSYLALPAWLLLLILIVVGAVIYGLLLHASDREAFELTAGRLRRILAIRPAG